jgi:hypothetical protein
MTLGPDGLVRDASGNVIPPGRSPYENPDLQPHFDRKTRIAFGRMAQACEVDPKRWGRWAHVRVGSFDQEDPSQRTQMWSQIALKLPKRRLLELWNEISRRLHAGVMHPDSPVDGDPYAVFVTGRCTEPHEGRGNHEQTAVVKTGFRVDEAEAKKITAYLRAQVNVNTCEVCGKKISIWSTDVTRISTFAARPENRNPIMASTIRGSDTP